MCRVFGPAQQAFYYTIYNSPPLKHLAAFYDSDLHTRTLQVRCRRHFVNKRLFWRESLRVLDQAAPVRHNAAVAGSRTHTHKAAAIRGHACRYSPTVNDASWLPVCLSLSGAHTCVPLDGALPPPPLPAHTPCMQFLPGPGNDTLTTIRFINLAWDFWFVLSTTQPIVAPKRPVPRQTFSLQVFRPGPLVQALRD